MTVQVFEGRAACPGKPANNMSNSSDDSPEITTLAVNTH